MKYKLCTKKELKVYFKDKSIAGGLSDEKTISIFMCPNKLEDEIDCTVQILVHEFLHTLLRKIIDEDACSKLDNIHHPFLVYNFETKKWSHDMIFIEKKKGQHSLII
jgi:hypothetical protein